MSTEDLTLCAVGGAFIGALIPGLDPLVGAFIGAISAIALVAVLKKYRL